MIGYAQLGVYPLSAVGLVRFGAVYGEYIRGRVHNCRSCRDLLAVVASRLPGAILWLGAVAAAYHAWIIAIGGVENALPVILASN